jgi:hypothetical protein
VMGSGGARGGTHDRQLKRSVGRLGSPAQRARRSSATCNIAAMDEGEERGEREVVFPASARSSQASHSPRKEDIYLDAASCTNPILEGQRNRSQSERPEDPTRHCHAEQGTMAQHVRNATSRGSPATHLHIRPLLALPCTGAEIAPETRPPAAASPRRSAPLDAMTAQCMLTRHGW